jgi:hypothetical protein
LISIIKDEEKLKKSERRVTNLFKIVNDNSKEDAVLELKEIEKIFNEISGGDIIKDKITKIRRTLKKDNHDSNLINNLISETQEIYIVEKERRKIAKNKLLPELINFNEAIKNTIGLRLQEKLTKKQAKRVAACRSVHRDISLNF